MSLLSLHLYGSHTKSSRLVLLTYIVLLPLSGKINTCSLFLILVYKLNKYVSLILFSFLIMFRVNNLLIQDLLCFIIIFTYFLQSVISHLNCGFYSYYFRKRSKLVDSRIINSPLVKYCLTFDCQRNIIQCCSKFLVIIKSTVFKSTKWLTSDISMFYRIVTKNCL